MAGSRVDILSLKNLILNDEIDKKDLSVESEKIGSGSTADVFKGLFKKNIEVAVKRIARESGEPLVSFKEKRKYAKNEIKILSIIKKNDLPHIVKYHGYIFSKKLSSYSLVFDYMRYGSLADQIDDINVLELGLIDKKKIGEQIAMGLCELHKYNIVHHDLNANNVLIQDEKLNIKLADFGLSKVVDKKKDELIVGTVTHMPPEIMEQNIYSTKVDIYSFSFTLYELYSWAVVYHHLDLTDNQVKDKCLMGVRPDTRFLPESVREIIKAGWLENPNDRPTAQSMLERVQAINIPEESRLSSKI